MEFKTQETRSGRWGSLSTGVGWKAIEPLEDLPNILGAFLIKKQLFHLRLLDMKSL